MIVCGSGPSLDNSIEQPKNSVKPTGSQLVDQISAP